jgi:hypothetical protein
MSNFVLLLVAGAAYSMVFARTSDLDYQGRQLIPALALLIGMGVVLFLRTIVSPRALFNRKGGFIRIIILSALFVSLIVLVSGQAKRTLDYVKDWPNHIVDQVSLNAYKGLNAMTDNDAVIFSVDTTSKKRYPQAAPTFEYYAGNMVLSFQSPEDMMRDMKSLKAASRAPFEAILFTPQFEIIEAMLPFSRGREVKMLGGWYALLIEADAAASP